MQSAKILIVLLMMLFALPAQAEKMALDELKDYLTRLKDKDTNPLDTYIESEEEVNITIREVAKGRPVVLHFWATWCTPCIKEMPALDELAGKIDEDKLFILALSEDFGGLKKVTKFYEQHNITNLTPYVDVMTGAANLMDVTAMPVTVFLDAEGRVKDKVTGEIHWKDEEIENKIYELIGTKEANTENADDGEQDDGADNEATSEIPTDE